MTNIADLAAFIPIDRRLALARGQCLPDRSAGTALFADVSGFTHLTGVLMEEMGPNRGAEELLNILNPVFKALIDKVHHYGGAVIGFAGDSITCWLAADDGARAIACALAMQEAFSPYRQIHTRAGASQLSLRSAIASGHIRRWIVGSDDSGLIDILAGETVRRMAAIGDLAKSGETLVEAEILRRLEGVVSVRAWRQSEDGLVAGLVDGLTDGIAPRPWTEALEAKLTDDQIRPWLLKPVYERLRAGTAYLAELRPVAALFLRFSGLDYDGDDDAGRKLDDYIRWVQQVLLSYHGYLIQLTIGDKGSFLYAAFGAPVTWGNNALLAVAAALDLQVRSTDFPGIGHIQIGISAGHMWTGAYGGLNRRTFGAIGNETNVAARLMVNARPGQILVTKRIVDEASIHCSFHELDKLTVKGLEKPVPIWEAMGRKLILDDDADFALHPLIGRQEPLATMQRLLYESQQGKGQIIDLVGDAGIGKSHLVAHFLRWAISCGLEPVTGSCQTVAQQTVYLPWRAIIRSLLGLDADLQEVSVALLSESLDRLNSDWCLRLPLLGDLLALPIEENATTIAMDAAMRQKALFSLVVEIIQSKSQEGTLLLAIDNGQWMDEASSALLETVARQAIGESAVLLLLSRRPSGDSPSSLSSIADSLPTATEIHLKGLSQDNLSELIRLKLKGQPSQLLVSIFQKMTRGNPFFAEELGEAMVLSGQIIQEPGGAWQVSDNLLDDLLAAGFVNRVNGTWALKEGVDLAAVQLGIPFSIQELILSRLDRLSEETRLTLKAGSVIGDRFNHVLLSRIHPQGKGLAQILADLEQLEAENIVYRENPKEDSVSFRHHTIQEVVYNTLLHTQRQHLHQRVAQALDEGQPDDVNQIAFHAFLGQSWSLALEYCLLAGQEAQSLHANKQSIGFFDKALQSARKLPHSSTTSERKMSHLAMGELLISAGDYQTGREHLTCALNLAIEMDDRECQACTSRWLGRSYELQGEYEQALSWLERGTVALNGLDSTEAVELSLVAGLIKVRQGQYDDASNLCRRGLQLALKLGDLAVEARTYNLMGIVDRRRGDSACAIVRFNQALVIYRQLANVYGEATSHNLIATSEIAQGNWREAESHYRRSLDLFTQIGDIYNQVLVNSNLGSISLRQGRLDEALDYYQKSTALLVQIGGSLWVIGALHMNTANAQIQKGDLDGAIKNLEIAQDHFTQAKSRDLLPELYGLLSEAALRRGHLEEAETHGQKSVALARELKMRREEGHNLRILGEIAQAKNQLDKAKRLLAESYTVLSEVDDAYERSKAQLSLVHLHLAMGEHQAAASELRDCEETFTLLGAELDLERVAEYRLVLTRRFATTHQRQ